MTGAPVEPPPRAAGFLRLDAEGWLACAIAALMLARVLFFLARPGDALVQVVPDDAFYYLEMARHRALDGVWSFDGVRPATGFHVLYGHLLAGAYAVFGTLDLRRLYAVVGVASSALMGISAWLVLRTARTLLGRGAPWWAALPFIGPLAVMQPTSLVESCLVLLFAAWTVHGIAQDEPPSTRGALALVAVGVLGSLARSDYGMLPGTIFAAHALAAVRLRDASLRRSALVLAGAVIGVGLVLLQTYAISGRLSQASAGVKLHWSSVLGHSTDAALRLAEDVILPSRGVVARRVVNTTLGLLGGTVLLALIRRTRREVVAAIVPGLRVALGCAAALAAYVAFYRFNSQAIQAWYAANLIVPSALVLATFGVALSTQPVLLRAAVAAPYLYASAAGALQVPYPHQTAMMRAGLYLKDRPDRGAYGSWNAGIISYFAGGGVVNVDGLTNDEIVPYILSNRLVEYLQARKIRHLVDFEEMLERPSMRARGGYDRADLDRCIVPVPGTEGLGGDAKTSTRIRVFEVRASCG